MGHKAIIDHWPSLGDFARDIQASYGAVKAMRRRGSIPSQYWAGVVRAALARKIVDVSLQRLADAVDIIETNNSSDSSSPGDSGVPFVLMEGTLQPLSKLPDEDCSGDTGVQLQSPRGCTPDKILAEVRNDLL